MENFLLGVLEVVTEVAECEDESLVPSPWLCCGMVALKLCVWVIAYAG